MSFPQGGSSPYGGTPAAIPGTIEVENYDNGGADVAYHDTTSGSHGQDYDNPPNYPVPSYRQPTDVDLYKYTPGYSNGYIALMQAGDWMKYSINVTQPGAYTIQTFAVWGGGGSSGTFHIEVDGVDRTGSLQGPTNWVWTTISKSGVQLTAGPHVLRFVADTNAGDG